MATHHSIAQPSEALEGKLAALRLSITCQREGYEANTGMAQFGRYERALLKVCDTYHWAHEIAGAVIESSKTLPGDTALDLSKFGHGRSGWFWFERPLHLGDHDDPNALEPFSGLLWTVLADPGERRTLFATTYVNKGRGPEATSTVMVKELYPLNHKDEAPDDRTKKVAFRELGAETLGNPESASPIKAFIISAMLWIEQKIVVESSERASRPLRRRIEKEHLGVSDEIKVIRLRRADHASDAEHGAVEWSCQWVVRGHWRQQFYPSTGERRPLFILPYVKGPDDKPLKAPTATVFSVSR